MFTITSTRIVGLIAVVCAVVVAPQALAASSTHSRIAPPGDEPSGFDVSDLSGRAAFTAVTPDAVQGNGVSGFDLGDLKNGRAFTAATHKSVRAATFVYAPTNPGWGAAATAAKESASKPAAKGPRNPVLCNGQAEYEYVWKGCEG
jgi:hypothetical protein